MEIALEDAFSGKQATIRVPGTVRLRALQRLRRPRRHPAHHLRHLRGAGKVRAQQGFFTVERTCPTCQAQARSSPILPRVPRRGPRAEGEVARG